MKAPNVSETSRKSEAASKSDRYSVNASDSEFMSTRKLFSNYIGYTQPLSYDQWVSLPDDHKAAALFVQFYDTIYLAYVKCRTNAASDTDCLEEVLQYIIKNVPIIQDNPRRFNSRYIYRISYNAIYCKSIDPYHGQTAETSWYNNTCSPYVATDSGEICMFDFMSHGEDSNFDFLMDESFWSVVYSVVDDMGPDAAFVLNTLCGGNATTSKFFGSEKHPNRHKRITARYIERVTEELKRRLIEFAKQFE